LEPVDVAIMAFAEKVALHAYKVTPEDVEGLRELRPHGTNGEREPDLARCLPRSCAPAGIWEPGVAVLLH
jgi:hypothetical protein